MYAVQLWEVVHLEITVNDIKVNYISEGLGDTVLILHGWGTSIEVYRSIINVLKDGMNVIALDMPGFGLTKEPETPWCVDDYLEFVISFAKQLGIKKMSLIGHSFGGRIIIKMLNAKNLPFETDKVVLIDSAGIRPKLSFKKRLKQRKYKLCKWFLNIGIVKWFYPDALDNLRSRHGSADYLSSSPVMRATLVKVVNEDLTHLLSDINNPTLLIWGDKDTATPFSDAETMHRLIKDSGIVKLEGAGHYSFLEQPSVTGKALRSFFGIKEEKYA